MHSREANKIRRLKEIIPIAFSSRVELPDEFAIPFELQYDYMMYNIAKRYGIPINQAGSHTEEDYWKMLAFENLESEREKFVRQLFSGKNQLNT